MKAKPYRLNSRSTGLLICLFLGSALLTPSAFAFTHVNWSAEMYHFVGTEYGRDVEQRMRQWHKLIDKNGHESWYQDLKAVNNFFNQVQWTSDSLHWGKKDYWQTPLETLIDFRGDCEDIAIAKYTTLRIMGYTEKQLSLVYSMAGKTPHMVLSFDQEGQPHPYILDSLNKRLLSSEKRTDLTSVFEFNNDTVWITDQHFTKYQQAKPEHYALLDELKVRLDNNRHLLRSHNNGQSVVPFSSNML